jgi:hypothetical protein
VEFKGCQDEPLCNERKFQSPFERLAGPVCFPRNVPPSLLVRRKAGRKTDDLGLHSPDSSVNQSAWCREVPSLVLRLIGCPEFCRPGCIGTGRSLSLEPYKPESAILESLVNWGGFASFEIDADELEHRVIAVAVAQEEFQHDITIVAEIHMMNLSKMIAVLRVDLIHNVVDAPICFVFRSSGELTRSDMAELYCVNVDAPQATNLSRASREQGFQLLEIKCVLRCARVGFVSDFGVTTVNS